MSEKKTKSIESIQNQFKVYTGTIVLGATTPSFDLETDPENFKDYSFVNSELIKEVFTSFVGEIEQFPPIFSAVMINGKRAYDLARQGKEVEVKSRKITIYSFELVNFNDNVLSFKVACSKGTYIRSLANDVGAKLGCGGYLSSLRRESIGEYSVDNAYQLPVLVEEIRSVFNEVKE